MPMRISSCQSCCGTSTSIERMTGAIITTFNTVVLAIIISSSPSLRRPDAIEAVFSHSLPLLVTNRSTIIAFSLSLSFFGLPIADNEVDRLRRDSASLGSCDGAFSPLAC